MPDQKLLSYIKDELAKNVDPQAIRTKLLESKWTQDQINEAFTSLPAQNPLINTAGTDSSTLPGFKSLLDQSWKIYKDRAKTLFAITILPVLAIIFGVMSASVSILLMISVSQGIIIAMILLAISIGLVILLSLWSPVALLIAIRDRNENIGFKASYGRSRSKILGYTFLSILTGVIITLGFILFVIPGIVFLVWFSVAAFVLVSENVGPIEALKRSKQYVKGKGFEVFYRLIAISLFTQIAFSIVLIIPVINFLAFFIVSCVFYPIAMIYSYLLYENLKKLNGKPISNPVSKVYVFLTLAVIGIIVLCTIVFATYFISNVIKNTPKPQPKIHYNDLYPTKIPTTGQSTQSAFPQFNITISPIASPSSIQQASESSISVQ